MDGQVSDLEASASSFSSLPVVDGIEISDMSELSSDEFVKDLEADFSDGMKDIAVPRRFLALHTLPEFPGGLYIFGAGNISAPLKEDEAQKILDKYGESDAAELYPKLYVGQFDLDNSIWPNIIQDCLNQAARELGITIPLMATPQRMFLLKRGQVYGKNELVSSSSDALGDLTIFLATCLEGGEMVNEHEGITKTVFAPNQAAQSYTTEDSNLESLPIQSGYLLGLLCSVQFRPLPAIYESRLVKQTLQRWIAKDREARGQDAIFFSLEHFYPVASKNNLMVKDKHRFQHLENLSTKLPYDIFFATIAKRNKSDLDCAIDQDKHYTATMFDLEGTQITASFAIDDSFVASDTNVPHTAVVIIPWDAVLSFFCRINSVDAVKSLFVKYARNSLEGHCPSRMLVAFKGICSFVMAPRVGNAVGHWAGLQIDDEGLLDVLEAFLVIDCPSWFSQFGLHYASDLPVSTFSRLNHWYDIENNKTLLRAIESVFSKMILGQPRPIQQLRAIKTIINKDQQRTDRGHVASRLNGVPGHIITFVRKVLNACILACKNKLLTAQDGHALVEFSLYFEDPFKTLSWILEQIGLERQPAVTLGLIHKVEYYGKDGYLPRYDALQFSQDTARALVISADFVHWRGTTDGHYFLQEVVEHMSFLDYQHANDSDLDEYLFEDDINSCEDMWDSIEEQIQQEEQEDYLNDDYDECEYLYTDSYRTCLYRDQETFRKHSKRGSKKNRYENLYGKTESLTFHPPGTEEKGVHYRSIFCFFGQLLRPVNQPSATLELFVSRFVNVASQIPHTEFDTLWIPLAKEFIPLVRCLGEIMEPSKKSYMLRFLSAILKAYVNTWVGRYPERPGLARPGVQCSCPNCKGLNVFLANPSLRAGRFVADRTQVRHVLDEMMRVNVDFKSEMMEDANSIALVVTKTDRLLAQARVQWGNRRYYATKQVAKFGLTGLEAVFGTEWMSFLSMGHLGGIGFDNFEIRTLLLMKTGLSNSFRKARSATMFYRGLPRSTTGLQVEYLPRKRKRWEVDFSSDGSSIFPTRRHGDGISDVSPNSEHSSV